MNGPTFRLQARPRSRLCLHVYTKGSACLSRPVRKIVKGSILIKNPKIGYAFAAVFFAVSVLFFILGWHIACRILSTAFIYLVVDIASTNHHFSKKDRDQDKQI